MKQILLIILIFTLFAGCKEKYTPKPRGFFRIDFPDKNYVSLTNNYPYQFEIPEYSRITQDRENPNQPYWINVEVTANKAELHISYYNLINSNTQKKMILGEFMEETRRLAYKHSVKADAIEEKIFINPDEKIFGTIYRIKGNAASPLQFFLTDSTQHFLRGALYIREVPNMDSIKPVIEFLEPDIIHLIETASWN